MLITLCRLCRRIPNTHYRRNVIPNLHKSNFFTNSGFNQKVSPSGDQRTKNIKSTLYYIMAAGVVTVGMSYAAVPLYRMFCQAYSYGGTTAQGHDSSKVESMTAVKHKPIKIKFNADTAASMRWNFKPQQTEITVCVCIKVLSNY